MGMTDRQFDVHLKTLLRDLKRIKKEYEENKTSETLEELVNDIDEQLKRP